MELILPKKKACKCKNIPIKDLKCSRSNCSETLKALFNKTALTGKPTELDNPLKDKPLNQKNYRPVNVLPAVSKLFGRIIHKKMNLHVDHYLPPINAVTEKDLARKKYCYFNNRKIDWIKRCMEGNDNGPF